MSRFRIEGRKLFFDEHYIGGIINLIVLVLLSLLVPIVAAPLVLYIIYNVFIKEQSRKDKIGKFAIMFIGMIVLAGLMGPSVSSDGGAAPQPVQSQPVKQEPVQSEPVKEVDTRFPCPVCGEGGEYYDTIDGTDVYKCSDGHELIMYLPSERVYSFQSDYLDDNLITSDELHYY